MARNISIKPSIIVSIVLLLLAIFPLPYGYYTLLRIVVCLTAGFLSWFSYKAGKTAWAWIMSFIALVFNPFIPILFGKEIWIVIDLVIAGIFGKFLFKFSKLRE